MSIWKMMEQYGSIAVTVAVRFDDAGLHPAVPFECKLISAIDPIDTILPADMPLLADFILQRKTEVDILAMQKRDKVIVNVSPFEAASWPIKRAEANAYSISSNAADAPSLSKEAAARGINLPNLVSKVINKASILSDLESAISGVNGKHNDALSAMTTIQEVKSYDITLGWPV